MYIYLFQTHAHNRVKNQEHQKVNCGYILVFSFINATASYLLFSEIFVSLYLKSQ